MSAVVTVGNFDGVHLGHLALVARAREEAALLGASTVALTFDPHPSAVLRPEGAPLALQTLEERIAGLRSHGCDHVEVIAFDRDLAAATPEGFVAEVLVERLGAAAVVVGENFRFGARAAGDVALLRELGVEHGFAVHAVPLVETADGTVSSSSLRALLAAGDLEAFARGFGRLYAVAGEVVPGDGRGRTIGIPTANVHVAEGRALPADGVYACWATTPGDEETPAVVNVGWRPTFDGTTRTVEAHLLRDDAPDLYGRTLELRFVARIRGEQRFDGPEALVARIREDIAEAGRLLSGS